MGNGVWGWMRDEGDRRGMEKDECGWMRYEV